MSPEVAFAVEKFVLAFAIFGLTLFLAMYATLAERKVAAFLQDRIGPNRAGPGGIFQPLADGAKFFFKEEIIPSQSNRFLFIIGPGIAMLTACMTSAVIPWSTPLFIAGREVPLQVADLNIGILYVIGVLSLGVYGIMIGGWASNNKYSLLGAIRASSQMISYELGMGLAIIAVLLMSGSLSLRTIVEQQHGFNWNVFWQPLGFLIFLVCAFAETNRAPFDLPECEAELVGGYHTEYSSMKLGFFMFAEYVNIIISAAIISLLYFGGYNYPFMDSVGASLGANAMSLLGLGVFFVKIFFFIFVFMWVRWTLPRFRYDQLMKLGWQVLIPLAILNILITGAVVMRSELYDALMK